MKNKNVAAIVGGLVVAATVFFLVIKNRHHLKETPPAKAPQVPLYNPGDQSDFPAAPTGDKDLG